MEYISCEGRYNIVYGYHFRLLYELRYGMDLPASRKLSLPYFLLQSLIDCGTKLNAGVPDQLAHHGLIKLLVEDAIHTYTIPIAWEIFRNMTREDDIKDLIDDLSPSSSEEEEQKKELEKEIHEEAQNIQVEEEKEEKQREQEKHDATTVEPKVENKTTSKTKKRKRTKSKKKKPKTAQKNTTTGKAKTQQGREKTPPEIVEAKAKIANTRKTAKDEEEKQQEEVSPETLAREAAVVHAALNTPTKQKGKRKRQTSMYFKAWRSTSIKVGKPQPPLKEPIIIEDAHTMTKEESLSKISITYERGSPKTSTWKEMIKLMDSKAVLQEAQTSLQETLTKLKETEKLEKKAQEHSQEEGKAKEIPQPRPQPNLGSYYNLLEGGKIIPQKFAVPLFFELEKETVRTHTWMQIEKSKGVEDIGHMENKLREMSRELRMVRHTKSIRRAQLQEENELLKNQLQAREP